MTDDEIAEVRAGCPRALTHHPSQDLRVAMDALAAAAPAGVRLDRYGSGGTLTAFEARIALELGKEAAVFMPSGTMAQQIAMRIWCDRRATPVIAFHPTSHLDLHEARAYSLLHGLRGLTIGPGSRLMTVEDLQGIAEPLGAVLVELPQREIGGQLPEWEALVQLTESIRSRGAAVHLDGARLWESAPHYGRSHAEIAALFDSVYVSFYKGLGGLAGAALAGDSSFIEEARAWQHRHGGRLFTIAPLAVSAQAGFERYLPRMGAYRERARAIAVKLRTLPELDLVPDPPHTNMFHIFIQGDRAQLEARAFEFARTQETFVFGRLAPTVVPTRQKWEFVVGEATMQLTAGAIAEAIEAVVRPGAPLKCP